jgi:hypothetical protein
LVGGVPGRCLFRPPPHTRRELGRFYDLFNVAVTVILIASQVFWIRRVRELGKRMIPSKHWRRSLGSAGLVVYFFLFGNHGLGLKQLHDKFLE